MLREINDYNHGLLYVLDSHVIKYTMYEQCRKHKIHLYEVQTQYFKSNIWRDFLTCFAASAKTEHKTYISKLVCTARYWINLLSIKDFKAKYCLKHFGERKSRGLNRIANIG